MGKFDPEASNFDVAVRQVFGFGDELMGTDEQSGVQSGVLHLKGVGHLGKLDLEARNYDIAVRQVLGVCPFLWWPKPTPINRACIAF